MFKCKKASNIFRLFTCLQAFINISQFNVRPGFKQQMVTYFRVSFCLSYIEIIVWASTLIKNVYFVDERVFQQKERSNVSHFSEIPKFYFIVTTLRSRIDAPPLPPLPPLNFFFEKKSDLPLPPLFLGPPAFINFINLLPKFFIFGKLWKLQNEVLFLVKCKQCLNFRILFSNLFFSVLNVLKTWKNV